MNILYAVTAESATQHPDGRLDIIGVHHGIGVRDFPAQVSPFIAVCCHVSDYDRAHTALPHHISLHVGRGQDGDDTVEIGRWNQAPYPPGEMPRWTYIDIQFQPKVDVTAPVMLHFEIRIDGAHWGRIPYRVYDLARPAD